MLSRRSCLFALAATHVAKANDNRVLGQGDFRYRVVPGWGVLDSTTPVKNCHGMARDAEGHVILLTDHTANNVIVYDKRGRLVSKWGNTFPGAHGLSLVREGRREVLYITDLQTHTLSKTTLDGTMLEEWRWPEGAGKYKQEADYKPSWTIHMNDGSFFVLDGYGRDYILRYNARGKMTNIFGGAEGGITHWGPHGGMLDMQGNTPTLLIAMSDQQYLLRLGIDGEKRQQLDLPGGNPRQIRCTSDITTSLILAITGRRTETAAASCRFWMSNFGWYPTWPGLLPSMGTTEGCRLCVTPRTSFFILMT